MPSETSEPLGAGHTDIRRGNWVDRYLPAPARPYARLARLDRPIGTWLLLLPSWWSIALAVQPGHAPDLGLMVLFAIGAVVMRGAGCTINDILDRKFDALVERTRVRPIPSGAVSVPQAIAFLIAQCLVGLGVLVQMNGATIALGAASLVLVAAYPLMKRVTWWPQAFLGLTFNWGALLGWMAVRGDFAWPPILLYAGGILWTLGYDTIYAHQDREDDVKVGVKSTALRLGAASKRWILGFYAGATALWVAAVAAAGIHPLAYLGVAATGALLLRQAWHWRPDDPADSLAAFKAARIAGWVLLGSVILGMAGAS